jgi:hypothetical protein
MRLPGPPEWQSQHLLPGIAGLTYALTLVPVALGGSLHAWMVVVVLALACSLVARPESAYGVAALLAGVFVWILAGPDVESIWTPVLGTLLLVAHVAMAWHGTAPPTARYEAAIVWRWVARTTAVAAATFVVYLVSVGLHALSIEGSVLLVAAGLLLFAALILVVRSDLVASGSPVARPPTATPPTRPEGARWDW